MRILAVKVDDQLVEALDVMARAESEAHPGRFVSRADVVREILTAAVAAKKAKDHFTNALERLGSESITRCSCKMVSGDGVTAAGLVRNSNCVVHGTEVNR